MGEDRRAVRHEVRVLPTPAEVSTAAARYVAERAAEAVADHGRFTMAVSGGTTPWQMFAALRSMPPGTAPWDRVVIYQVDERVAPPGDARRNIVQLREALGDVPAQVVAMPVEDEDLAGGAARYAALLPARFDLIHLGLGADGHTASLVPGDPVLNVTDRLTALTGAPYQGQHRMTLTYRALARADQLLWLVTGASKAAALRALLDGSGDLPAVRVRARRSLVMADRAAAGAGSAPVE